MELMIAKRRRKGELSEKERLHFRLMQINQENEKTINQMLHDNEISKQTTSITYIFDIIFRYSFQSK